MDIQNSSTTWESHYHLASSQSLYQ